MASGGPAVPDGGDGRNRGEASGASSPRRVALAADSGPFSLAWTCGPVAWGGGRWPNLDWIDGALIWVGWEGGEAVWRRVRQGGSDGLIVEGNASACWDGAWAERVLGVSHGCPTFGDPVLTRLRADFRGLRAFAQGSLYDGLVTAIVGQSISLAAAAVAEARLSRSFHSGIEIGGRRYWPLPRPDRLAEASVPLIREAGVTWRRAEALVAVGRAVTTGVFPGDGAARGDPDGTSAAIRALPLVGPWTAASALLWGVGAGDAYPAGDAALLRAARRSYGAAELSAGDLARLADGWRPHRGWAARLLWAGLFGAAPSRGDAGGSERSGVGST